MNLFFFSIVEVCNETQEELTPLCSRENFPTLITNPVDPVLLLEMSQ